MEIYKTAIYCRLSQDDGQEGDSSSITTQKMMLERYCRENGYPIHDYYVDDGYSGLNFDRPEFQRMLGDIDAGLVNMVITKDLSRLGRDYIRTGYYMEIYFSNKNVRYIAVTDGIDTIKDNNDIAPFKNILNDMYAKDISRKIRTAKRQRMYKGMYVAAQPPFGYKVDKENKNRLIIDEEAVVTVKLIYSLALTNIGVVRIVRELNERGIKAPSVYKAENGDLRFMKLVETRRQLFKNYDVETWNTNTVGTILRDIVYVGDMENHKYEVRNYKTKKCTKVPKEDHIIVRNTHEPIISREDFKKVQELIRNRQRPGVHHHPNIFKGVLKCEECGRTLTLCYNKMRDGKLIWRYKCMGKYLKHGTDTTVNSIRYDDIYDIVFEKVRNLLKSVKNNEEIILKEIAGKCNNSGQTKKLEAEVIKINKRQEVISKLMKRIYEDYVTETLLDANYQKMLGDYQTEQKQLSERLTEIAAVLGKEENREDGINKFKAVANQYLEVKELTAELVNNLIDRIEIGHVKTENGEKSREINIIYRFIG